MSRGRYSKSLRRGIAALAWVYTVGVAWAAPGDVVVNEIDYDQPSTDAAEFIEIQNVTASSVDLSTYQLQLVNGSTGSVYDTIALSGTLAAGDYFVVCGDAANVANCDLDVTPNTNLVQNGAPDAVALFDGGTLIDTVSYEGDTIAPFTEGSGAGLIDDPGLTDSGISRCPDGTDSDQNNADLIAAPITPGEANDCTPPAPELVINEIDYDQPGTDSAEFVEILNVGAGPADLGGIELQFVNGSGGGAVVYDTIPLSGTLAAGDYFVVCANSATVSNCDLDDGPDTNFIQNGAPDAVALFQGTTLLDTVSYEGDTGAPFTEGSGTGLVDDSGLTDSGISRCPDGADGDQNNADLTPAGITPGAVNDCPSPDADLVINEIDYDQSGTDAAEFVELKNVGASSVDLTGFALEFVNGNGGAVYDTIALSGTLAAGDYFVVCANAATVFGCDLDDGPDTNFIQNGSPDAVAITFGGAIVDTVSYEGDTAGFTEGSGSGLEDSPSVENLGISRFPDGIDTDQNNVDLSQRCITPGAANSADSSSCPTPGPPQLVVNEIDYDQPGADNGEFVEIYNAGNGAADLTGVVLELVNGSNGSAYQTIALPSVVLGSGGFFVICEDASDVPNCDLDAISSIQNGSPDAVALTFQGLIVDTVSYEGDTTGFTEGSGAGLTDSGSSGEDFKGISRLPNGVDTDQNNVDLANVCVTPGGPNSSLSTGCGPSGPVLEIFQIQGSGSSTPFANETVSTADNVVTAVGTDGFFIQTPTARTDSDVDTSDGIFVFTVGAPGVAVGDRVDVTGTASEFFDFTEIGFASFTVTSTGALPAPVVFDATVPSPDPTTPSCAIEFECYEGMLVEIAEGSVGGSNQRFSSDLIAEAHIRASVPRAFREPGVEFPGLGMPPIPTWDGNPEVFELDPDKLGLPNLTIPAGSIFSATGVIGFEFGGYELWPSELTVGEAPLPVPVRQREPGEFTIATLNLFRLFDDVDDPPSMAADGRTRDDAVVSTEEYLRRRAKFAAYILDVLDAPDVLAVQEAEKLGVLEDLASDILALEPTVVYSAFLEEGNDVGTIDVGFLVRDTVQVDAVTQLGKSETFVNPITLADEILHDRPPLLLEARISVDDDSDSDSDSDSDALEFEVLGVHNRSLGGIDGSEGERVRAKRLEQAQSIAAIADLRQGRAGRSLLLVTGDFNAFEFTDGYVDVIGQIKGDFDPTMNLLSGPDLVNPNLRNVVDTIIDPLERYSFIFRGSAQVLDHALASAKLQKLIRGAEFGRGNTDAAVDLINDDTTVLRASDHDGLVVYVQTDPRGRGRRR